MSCKLKLSCIQSIWEAGSVENRPKCPAVGSHLYNSDIGSNTLNLKYIIMKRIYIVLYLIFVKYLHFKYNINTLKCVQNALKYFMIFVKK